MNDKQAGSVVLVGSDMAELFHRTANALEKMEVVPADINSVSILPLRDEADKRMIEVVFNNVHDPENCQGCDYERDHPEWKQTT